MRRNKMTYSRAAKERTHFGQSKLLQAERYYDDHIIAADKAKPKQNNHVHQ
jgi:hypothetical protein